MLQNVLQELGKSGSTNLLLIAAMLIIQGLFQ
jgi:hypothetical protein